MGDKSNFHLVRWDKISAPLQSEGLAIRNLRRFNEELLGKWWWRFGNDQDVLWRRVIEVKYGCTWGGGMVYQYCFWPIWRGSVEIYNTRVNCILAVYPVGNW